MERIEEIIKWLKEKWIGVVFPLLGILLIAFGLKIIFTTSKESFGGFLFVFGGLLLFGLLWLT